MKKEYIIRALSGTLALSGFLQDFEHCLTEAKDIIYKPNVERVITDYKSEYPIITNGYPEMDDDESDEINIEIFKAGFIHYNERIITLIILSPELKHANKLALDFKDKLDSELYGIAKKNGDWKMDMKGESISPSEVMQIASKAEILYTVMSGLMT